MKAEADDMIVTSLAVDAFTPSTRRIEEAMRARTKPMHDDRQAFGFQIGERRAQLQ